MRHKIALPAELGSHFAVRAAAASGIARGRSAAADLHRPFHGARATAAPTTFFDVVASYRPLMKPHHRFGGLSALRLWRLPAPHFWRVSEALEIMVPLDKTPPKRRGILGRRLGHERAYTWRVYGVAVVDPIAALFTCAARLTVAEVIVVIEAMITTADNYPRLLRGRPLITIPEIESRLIEWGSFAGCGRVRSALGLARERVESPKETQTRLMLLDAGLPEPDVQFEVLDDGVLIARTDLAYPRWKIAIEYEGDGHRTDKRQWRVDIQRQRELEDRGWIVIRLTELDLHDRTQLIARVRRAIAARRPGLPRR